MTNTAADKLAVTPKEAGHISGLGLVEITNLMDKGELPFIWKGTGKRYRLVLVETLREYLRKRQVTA
jgi:hypothetical protein